MSSISSCPIRVLWREMSSEKSIGKNPNAVSATTYQKSRRPEVPDRPTRFSPERADKSCGSHTTVTLYKSIRFRGTDRRIGHREQLIVCQLRFTLPSESRLVRPELHTVEFSIPLRGQAFFSPVFRRRLNLSRRPPIARKPPCTPSSKPNVRRWRQACLPPRPPSSHARDKLHLVCSRVSLAGRSI
jgi:hypothetical protein